MFGTFRYNKQTKNHEHVEISTANGVEARGYTSVACDYCRFRKVSHSAFLFIFYLHSFCHRPDFGQGMY